MPLPSFLQDYADELEYLDPNDTLKRWLLEAKFGIDPIGTYKLLKDKGIGAYTDVLAAPKRAVDIISSRSPINPDNQGPIRPVEESLKDAILPRGDISPIIPPGLEPIVESLVPGGGLLTAKNRLQEIGEISPKTEEIVTGIGRGTVGTGGRFGLDPSMYALGLPGILGRGLGAYFGVEGAKAGGTNIGTGISELEGGNTGEGLEHIVEGGGDILASALAFGHSARGSEIPLEKVLPEDFSKPVVWETSTPPRIPLPESARLEPETIDLIARREVSQRVDESSLAPEAIEDLVVAQRKKIEAGLEREYADFEQSMYEADLKREKARNLELKPIAEKSLGAIKEFLAPDSDLPGGSEAGVIDFGGKAEKLSEQADLLHRLLKGSKQTKVNVAAIDRTFQEMGVPLTPEMKADLPVLLKEMSDKGYARIHPGGTYTILSGAGRGLKVETAPKAGPSDLERQLQATLDAIKTTSRPIKSEIVIPERQPGEPPVGEIEELGARRPKRKVDAALRDQVNLIDDISAAQDKEILTADQTGTGSLKERANLVDRIEKAQAAEEAGLVRAGERATTAEQKKLLQEQQKLERAQNKEKLAKQSFEVVLSDGSKHYIKARSELAAREYVENKLAGSKLKVADIGPRKTTIEKALSKPEKVEVVEEKKGFINHPAVKVLNSIKSIAYGGDVGHLLRQGKQMNAELLFSRNADKVFKQFPVLFKAAKSESFFNDFHKKLANDPDIARMVGDFKLDMPGLGEHLKEEAFHGGEPAESIPVLGKYYVKPSNRVYTTGLNFLRAEVAKQGIESLRSKGFTMESSPEKYRSLARGINIISQRGDFNPAYQKVFSDASAIFGAPRAKAARLQQIPELFKNSESGRLARRSMAKAMALNVGLIAILKAKYGDDLEFVTDPKRTDYLKLRKGNVTVDPLMGLGVTIRTAARIREGEAVSPYTGKKYQVTPGAAISRELTGMIAPGVAAGFQALFGKDFQGFQKDRISALANVLPLTYRQIEEIYQEEGMEGIIFILLQLGGEGVDTFNYEEARAEQEGLKAERGIGPNSRRPTNRRNRRRISY